MKSVFVLLTSLLPLSGAHAAADPTFALTATAGDFGRYFPTSLGNGYFSTISGARGTEGNPAYMVGLMDYGKDDVSRPAAVPGWTEIDYSAGDSKAGHFWMNQVRTDPNVFADYRQTLDMKAATLTTSYRYDDHGRKTRIEVTTFVSQASPHLAGTRLSITPEFDGTVELSFALNLWAPHQPRFAMGKLSGDEMQEAVAAANMNFEATPPATPDRAAVWYHGDVHVPAADGDVKDFTMWLDGRAEQGMAMAEAAALRMPAGVQIDDAKLYRSDYRLALNLDVKVQKGKTYTFDKIVAASRADWGGDAKADLALAQAARKAGFDKLLDAHRAAWRDLWRSDIVIDGDATVQTLVHSDLYYLLSSSTADTRWSIGACAMTPGYSGHIFWDADTWIYPALLLLHPQRAKSLVAFRAYTLPAALARAREAGFKGAKYPWEADAENGTEQTPHPAHVLGEREIHINADVGIAQWQYWLASHDKEWLKKSGWPVIRNLADFWASRATWKAEANRYEIEHVTSVAESYNDVPNDTFTNASAQKVLRIAVEAAQLVGDKPDPHWSEVADKLYIPFSDEEQRHYDFDPSVPREPWEGSALALLMYPNLDFALTPQIRRNDFNHVMQSIEITHHEPHGMIAAPSSIAAASVGDSDRAVAWMQGIFTSGLLKPPFNVRTETASNNTGYFATASGGFLQILMYGFAGLRIQENGLADVYAPVLPPSWKSMTLKNVAFRGHRYDIRIDRGVDGKPRLTRKTL